MPPDVLLRLGLVPQGWTSRAEHDIWCSPPNSCGQKVLHCSGWGCPWLYGTLDGDTLLLPTPADEPALSQLCQALGVLPEKTGV